MRDHSPVLYFQLKSSDSLSFTRKPANGLVLLMLGISLNFDLGGLSILPHKLYKGYSRSHPVRQHSPSLDLRFSLDLKHPQPLSYSVHLSRSL